MYSEYEEKETSSEDIVSILEGFPENKEEAKKEVKKETKKEKIEKIRKEVLSSYSVDEQKKFLEIEKKYLNKDFNNILQNDLSFFSRISFDIDEKQKEASSPKSKKKVSPSQEQSLYEEFLSEKYDFRLVTLRDEIEYKDKNSSSWLFLDDVGRERISREAYGVIEKMSVPRLWTTIVFLASQTPFNPITNFVDTLPKFEGQDELGKLLSFIKFRDDHPKLTNRRRFELMMSQAITKWCPSLDTRDRVCCFVLASHDERVGKSRLIYEMVPLKDRYVYDDVIKPREKDFMLSQVKLMAREISELSALLKTVSDDEMKNLLTRNIVSVRKPYGRSEIDKRTFCFFYATVNNPGDMGFLHGYENSRYLVCNIESIDWRYSSVINWQQFWAQALQMTKEKKYLMTAEELKAQKEINAGHKEESPLKDLILDKYIITLDKKDVIKGKDLLDLTKDHSKIQHKDIPFVLASLKVIKKTTNKGKFYLGMREKTEEERNAELSSLSQGV